MENEKTEVLEAEEKSPSTESAKEKESVAVISPESEIVEFLAEQYGCEKTEESVMSALKMNKVKNELAARMREDSARRRYEELVLESEEIKELDAGFSLERELQDVRFRKLLQCGFNVLDAWQFTHFEEILVKIAEDAEMRGYENAVKLLREGLMRPEENGTREGGSISAKKSASELTGSGIREILKRVEKGAKIKF